MSDTTQGGVGRRILVVDDYRPMANLMAGTLCGSGHDARTAYNAAEALRMAAEIRPEALVSDAHLPDMDGWTLGAEIERSYPGCRVLLMSADPYLFKRPANAPHYKIVQKSTVLEELEQLLGMGNGAQWR